MNEEILKKWVGGVCIKEGSVLLIHRVNKKQVFNPEYFIFPGEMVGEDQSLEQALLDEFKKLGTVVAIGELLYEQSDDETTEYYYACHHEFGEINLETREYEEDGHLQKFTPVWVRLEDLDDLIVYPETLKEEIVSQNAE
jgi:ADP-ribose pyrophosphatase YjhB (NUDIX family)